MTPGRRILSFSPFVFYGDSMSLILNVIKMVLPVLAMILIGSYAGKKQIITKTGIEGIRTVIGDITLPVVLFNAFFTAKYNLRMLLVFICVYAGFALALFIGFASKRFLRPYDRFLPFLLTSAEGGMLGYALFSLLAGDENTSIFAIVDIGQTVFAYTLYLTFLKLADGKKTGIKDVAKDVVTNKACIGMLLGIVLGATGIGGAVLSSEFSGIVTELISFITAPTSALILLIVGFDLHFSKEIMSPVIKTAVLRIGIMALLLAAVGSILFTITAWDKNLFMALALMYSLPAPFIIPLFADVGKDGAYVSTALSVETLVTVILFIPLVIYSFM